MKKTILLIVMITIIALFTSCKKDNIDPPTIQKPQSMNELVASPTFDWKTTKDYHFSIKGINDGVLKIISDNGVVYHRGNMKANTVYSINISLPSYEKSVRLVYWGNEINCVLTQTIINYTFTTK